LTDLSVIIPFYNEADNLPAVPRNIARALEAARVDFEVLTVDNGSHDRTGDLLRALSDEQPAIRVVTVARNEGYGWGVLSGLREARGEYVGFMGGDGQIAPSDVVRTWRRLQDDRLDFCKATRVVRKDGWRRRLITTLTNMIFPLLFGVRTRDINGTPKMFRASYLPELDLRSKDWFLDAEVMIKLTRLGARMGEVPVTFLPREKGSSNVRFSAIWEFLRNIARVLLGGGW